MATLRGLSIAFASVVSLSVAACDSRADSRVDVTISGVGLRLNQYFGVLQGKSAAEAFAAAKWAGAVAYSDADRNTKSQPAGADGAFSVKFKAAQGAKVHLFLMGGSDPANPVIRQAWPVEWTVPTDGKPYSINAGVVTTDTYGDPWKTIAQGMGITLDNAIAEGTSMYIVLATSTPPAFDQEGGYSQENSTIIVDDPSISISAAVSTGWTLTTGSGSSPFGFYGLSKKGATQSQKVKVHVVDNATGPGHPYTYADVVIPLVQPGFDVDYYHAHR
jgi:hypothetical protein